MNTYKFELLFKLNDNEDPENHLDALFEAGCDDALPGIGLKGSISLAFSREGISAFEATKSALLDVRKAIPHAMIEGGLPYLMNLSDLANEFGFSKQNMSKYARGESKLGTMPSPIIASKTSFWIAAEVAIWLSESDVIELSTERKDTFMTIWNLNNAIASTKAKNQAPKQDFSDLLKCA